MSSTSDEVSLRLKKLLKLKAHYKVADFDDHCDVLDWCGPMFCINVV
jgi:hypothetical protein